MSFGEMTTVMDVHHSSVSASPLLPDRSPPTGFLPPPCSPSHTLRALVIYKCNPLLHTYTNCLQLEVAAMTFLWEMKISGGAEQPILDSVVN